MKACCPGEGPWTSAKEKAKGKEQKQESSNKKQEVRKAE